LINKEISIRRKFENDLKEIIVRMLEIFQFNAEISKMIHGRSGIMHEIDIFAEKRDEPQIRLLIKYKSFMEEDTLRLSDVLCFWAQILDISADQGIILTSCKVSESAAKFAEHHGIQILASKRPNELKYKILELESLIPKMLRHA